MHAHSYRPSADFVEEVSGFTLIEATDAMKNRAAKFNKLFG